MPQYKLVMPGQEIFVYLNRRNIVADSTPIMPDIIGKRFDVLVKYFYKRFGKRFKYSIIEPIKQ